MMRVVLELVLLTGATTARTATPKSAPLGTSDEFIELERKTIGKSSLQFQHTHKKQPMRMIRLSD